MKPGRFFWKLFLGNAALMVVLLGTCVWFMLVEFERFHGEILRSHLQVQAAVLEAVVRDRFDTSHQDELARLARQFSEFAPEHLRITFIAPDGRVLGDSRADPAELDSHADRPEFKEALRNGTGSSTRWSVSVSDTMQYAALRVGTAAAPRGVVRVALPAHPAAARADAARRLLQTIAFLTLLAAVALALGLARLWSRRIGVITAAARAISGGDLRTRVPIDGADEVSMLALSLNRMREHLARQLDTIERQRRTLDALMTQLHEGMVVARPDGRILLVNPEAVRLLGLISPRKDGSFEGLPVETCIPQHDLQVLLVPPQARAHLTAEDGDVDPLAEETPGRPQADTPSDTQEVRVRVDGRRGSMSLLVRAFDIVLPTPESGRREQAAPLRPARMLMLTDVTELTKLMHMKADFAANASHELRTPLSAIRGAAETLRTMDLAADAQAAGAFVAMIERHCARMEAMVVDLLDLSRVESPVEPFAPQEVTLRDFWEELRESFADALSAGKLNWQANVSPECQRIMVSEELLRIVLRNLVENAVRFTPEGGHIQVSARADDNSWIIAVADDGCGIPLEDQARVFERFYQVARARSGPNRGTGLGLSIVRHAVSAMHGAVRLESAPGKGTTVTVTIPQQRVSAVRES